MIILADLHLREETADTVLNQILPEVGIVAVDEGSKEIAILGDVLTFRYKIDARLQNWLIDCLKDLVAKDIRIHILPGNHDQYEVGGRNALEPLNEIHNVQVYTNPSSNVHGYWLPYRKNREDILKGLEMLSLLGPELPAYTVPNILFAHHGIQGAYMNDNVVDESGLPIEYFSKFDRVLMGHYHKPQQIGNCYYIGSPYQTKADEAGQLKGYTIWDGMNLTFVAKNWGKKYHNIKVDNYHAVIDLSNVQAGDEVRVSTAAGIDPKSIIDRLQKSGVDHIVTPKMQITEVRLEVEPNASLTMYAQAYVDAQQTGLDKQRLMGVFNELQKG